MQNDPFFPYILACYVITSMLLLGLAITTLITWKRKRKKLEQLTKQLSES